jgi:hypothetical protein
LKGRGGRKLWTENFHLRKPLKENSLIPVRVYANQDWVHEDFRVLFGHKQGLLLGFIIRVLFGHKQGLVGFCALSFLFFLSFFVAMVLHPAAFALIFLLLLLLLRA